jgi:N-acetylgalactosamine-6-sulfatase
MKHALASLLAVLITPVSVLCAAAAPESIRPNVLFIYMDDWGWGDLSCHGHPYLKTPNLDRLAVEGTDFQQFNVLSPVCSPSRTAAVTGKFPSRYSIRHALGGAEDNRRLNQCDWLDPSVTTTARLFQQAGYATGHFGKWHLGRNPNLRTADYGYAESSTWAGPEKPDELGVHGVYEKAIAFLRAHRDQPFYLDLWPHETHAPQLPSEESMREYAHLDEQHRPYAASIADGDKGVGRVLNALKELGLEQNTIVLFSSDNGPESTGSEKEKQLRGGYGTYYSTGSTGGLRGRKRSLYEGGVRVPFLVRWPGHTPAGAKNEATVLTAVDLLPTLCAAAGVPLPGTYQSDGENVLEAFHGKPFERTKPVFWDFPAGNGRGLIWASLAVREGEWKLVMDERAKRRELYRVLEDRAEAQEISGQHLETVERLTKMALDWKASLPAAPDPACCSQAKPGKARNARKPGAGE